jgi:hypothetical protein
MKLVEVLGERACVAGRFVFCCFGVAGQIPCQISYRRVGKVDGA